VIEEKKRDKKKTLKQDPTALHSIVALFALLLSAFIPSITVTPSAASK